MALYPYLNDTYFLLQIDNMQEKEQFVKITVLDKEEKPIRAIEGQVTSGSLNINGSSAIRRNGNISFVVTNEEEGVPFLQNLFFFNNRIKLEIGFINTLNKYTEYKTIWFPLGIYIISKPSVTNNSGGVNVSLTLNDKMVLLDGSAGGIIPSVVDFHEDAYGKPIPFYQCIQELVHHWGGEQLGKIIIENVPEYIDAIVRWGGKNNDTYTNGELIGKKREIAHFTSDVTSQPGDSVVTILDKIKQQLGNYEYFYDLDGNFVFREKRNYLNTSYSTYLDENRIDLDKSNFILDMTKGRSIYNFTNSNLITSYSNSPAYDEVKNEFIVWGKKEGNESLPCRYRLVIDSKPVCRTHKNIVLYLEEDGNYHALKSHDGLIENIGFISVTENGYFKYIDGDFPIFEEVVAIPIKEITSKDWREELYYQGIEALATGADTGVYFEDLRNEWPKLYDLQKQKIKDVYLNDPLLMDYYLDFIDTNEELSKISVAAVGRRTKAQNIDSVNCVFEFNVPAVYFYSEADDEAYKVMIQNYAQAQDADYMELSVEDYASLKLSSTANDAYTEARAWLYESTQRNSTISISAVPIYYLDANSRITVSDSVSGIQGDFLINSISLPLDISGTMTLSCSQVLQKP